MANSSPFPSLARIPDRELQVRVKRLVHHELRATARLVAHLAELDQRRLYLEEGCSSLFTYCTQVLHLSESAAYRRIVVARAARKYPLIFDLMIQGDVHLVAVVLLAPHLTLENHRDLLARARHQSKRSVEEMIARLQPVADVPTIIRGLPNARSASGAPTADSSQQPVVVGTSSKEPGSTLAIRDRTPAAAGEEATGASPDALVHRVESAAVSEARPLIAPLSPDRYKVQFTADRTLVDKLCKAQDLLRHRIPDGDPVSVLDFALTVLLKQLEKTKLAAVENPRARRGPIRRSRYIPATVKRAVWRRDGGRCAFVGRNGRRCSEAGFLEFHHEDPHGATGRPTIDNVHLRCRSHNRYESEMYFGPYVPRKKDTSRNVPRDNVGRKARSGQAEVDAAESAASESRARTAVSKATRKARKPRKRTPRGTAKAVPGRGHDRSTGGTKRTGTGRHDGGAHDSILRETAASYETRGSRNGGGGGRCGGSRC
jgi:hypothetical protein